MPKHNPAPVMHKDVKNWSDGLPRTALLNVLAPKSRQPKHVSNHAAN